MKAQRNIVSILIGIFFLGIILVWIYSWMGCAYSFYWPEFKKSREIRAINDLDANCLDMSTEYYNHLKSKGYNAKIECGRIPGYIDKHCWVEVKNPDDGKWYLIDLAFDTGGFEVKHYKERF